MPQSLSVIRHRRLLVAALLVVSGLLPAAGAAQDRGASGGGPRAAHDVESRRLERRDTLRARLASRSASPALPDVTPMVAGAALRRLRPGELVSASERRGRALRIVLTDSGARVKRTILGEPFVPRAVDFDSRRRLLAVAAVSRVFLYQVDDDVLSVIAPEGGFAFANDVLFDDGVLVVADMGEAVTGQLPRDGVVWSYDLDSGEFGELAERRAFSNPKLLARDSRGRLHIVDGEAGPPITPQFELRYDVLYRVKGARQKLATPIYQGAGVLASAYAIGPDDRHWFGNVDEIAILPERGAELEIPCPVGSTFDFVSGLVFQSESRVYLLDGANTRGPDRTIYAVDDACSVEERVQGPRIAESRGLAMVEEIEDEDEG